MSSRRAASYGPDYDRMQWPAAPKTTKDMGARGGNDARRRTCAHHDADTSRRFRSRTGWRAADTGRADRFCRDVALRRDARDLPTARESFFMDPGDVVW